MMSGNVPETETQSQRTTAGQLEFLLRFAMLSLSLPVRGFTHTDVIRGAERGGGTRLQHCVFITEGQACNGVKSLRVKGKGFHVCSS